MLLNKKDQLPDGTKVRVAGVPSESGWYPYREGLIGQEGETTIDRSGRPALSWGRQIHIRNQDDHTNYFCRESVYQLATLPDNFSLEVIILEGPPGDPDMNY